MIKKKVFLAITTVALSAAMVGAASAGTFDNSRQAAPAKSTQHQVYMTDQDTDAMIKAMDTNQHKVQDFGRKGNQDTINKKANSDSNVNGNHTGKMGPRVMDEQTFEQLAELHGQNKEKMNEIHQDDMPNGSQMAEPHESMSQSNMHQGGEKMKAGKGGRMAS